MKIVKLIIVVISITSLLTGCGKEKENINNGNDNNTPNNGNVVDNQIFEGLEFVNVGIDNGVIKTIIINNTGVTYEGSKISIKVMDSDGNVITEEVDEVKDKIETGNTLTIETKTNKDLSNAASIEYSVIK